jgi:WD40 repeat protein
MCASFLRDLVHDEHRFIMHNKMAIEAYPLQTYASAMVFSPEESIIKKLFWHKAKKMMIKPALSDWGACLQTFEGHSSAVTSVAFSHDSTKLASASSDKTVKIWDAASSACLQTLDVGQTLYILSFNSNSSCLYTEIGAIAIKSS